MPLKQMLPMFTNFDQLLSYRFKLSMFLSVYMYCCLVVGDTSWSAE